MTANPYEAPKAELADTPEVLPPGPRAVSIALGLVLGAVILQMLSLLLFLQETNWQVFRPWPWAGRAFDWLLVGFLCHQMSRRRNWARIVLLCLALISFAQLCYGIGAARRYLLKEEFLDLMPRFVLVQVLPVAMTLLALHLLFFSSGDWFRRSAPD